MAEILLFHHVHGLTTGIVAFADTLRQAGHVVYTPDLFEGRTFDTLQEGVNHAREVGFGEIIRRGARAADGLPDGMVYAGFSLGVLPAQYLAQTRPAARGALFFHSCVPASEFESPWREGLPAQIHAMDKDPSFVEEGDIEAAQALVAEHEEVKLFLYPGDKHLFSDKSLADYDPAAAGLLMGRVLDFLSLR
jgi:dienelactone hydrolase